MGSSSRSSDGRCRRSRASAARIRQPPENSLEGTGEVRIPEAEPAQDDPRLGLEPVAPERLEVVLEVAVAQGERLVGRLVEPRCQRLQLALDLPDLREPGQDLAEDGATDFPGRLLG